AKKRLQSSLRISKLCPEAELICKTRSAGREIIAGSDMQFIKHVVVKSESIGPDTRLFEWPHRKRDGEILVICAVGQESIDVCGVRSVVQCYQWRVHMTGAKSILGQKHQRTHQKSRSGNTDSSHLFLLTYFLSTDN